MPEVHVECRLAPGSLDRVTGTLNVQVVDVSRADAPSIVVAQWVGERAEMSAQTPVRCAMQVRPPASQATYAVQAHLDRDGSGETSVGDYRTMAHIPLTQTALQNGPVVELALREVR
ncbi:MAG: YbaY family lipoprotein [Ornithinimicrobium sp.]